MMNIKSATFALVSLVLAMSIAAQDPCFARITATARTSWTDGVSTFRIFDITATNSGTCPLTRIVGFFSARGGVIGQTWNYESSTGAITGFGQSLAPGQSFAGAGFVLINSTSPTLAFDRPQCNNTCYNGTPAPTQTAATTAPVSSTAATTAPASSTAATTAPASSTAATTAPLSSSAAATAPLSSSAATTAPSTGCSIVATLTRDVSAAAWVDASNRTNAVYRLSLTNQGPCPLTTYVVSLSYYPATLISSWNLQSSLGGYLVTGYGASLAAGSTYNGAGVILAGAPAQVYANGYGSICSACA